jgi:hypothetical protein
MIARRMRRYAALRPRIVERENSVGRAARLERADLLKIFALKKQRRTARPIQQRARDHRRTMNVRTNAFMCSADGREVEWHSFYVRDSKYESTTYEITTLGDEREEIE